MNTDDLVIKRVYIEFDVPSDQITQHLDDRSRFIQRLRKELGQQSDDELIARMVRLRKNGFLPPIRRKDHPT